MADHSAESDAPAETEAEGAAQPAGEAGADTPDTLSADAEPEPEPEPEDDAPPPPATPEALRSVLEALLFVSKEPLTSARLQALTGAESLAPVKDALTALDRHYAEAASALRVVEVAGGFQLLTRAEHHPYIVRLKRAKSGIKLSRHARDTLAILAYKQPITRAEIDAVRGANSSHHMRLLVERDLIKVVGRKNVPGAPVMYGTTRFFLQHFALKSLRDLPVEPDYVAADGAAAPLFDSGELFNPAEIDDPRDAEELAARLDATAAAPESADAANATGGADADAPPSAADAEPDSEPNDRPTTEVTPTNKVVHDPDASAAGD